MNKNDKQILDMLEKEFKSNVENVNVPLRLQKESIVNMLENADKNETDFSVKTGTAAKSGGSNNIVILRKAIATAAMVALVISGVLVMRSGDGVDIVRADSFHEEYKGESPVKGVNSIADIEKVIEDIRKESKDSQKNTTAPQTTAQSLPTGNKEVTAAPQPEIKNEQTESIVEGYSGYISGAKLEEMIIGKDDKTVDAIVPKESDGVATYGDFKADIIKTDSKYLYIASTGINTETGDSVEQIKIVKASGDGSMEAISDIILSENKADGNFDKCIEIYLKDNKLTAIMNRQVNTLADTDAVNSSVVALYYDITDPYAPVKIREHIQDGEYISSSLYENKLCLITEKTIPENLKENTADIIPSFSVDGTKVTLKVDEDIRIAINDPEESYLFVTVTDITDFTKGVGRFALFGCDNRVYCTPNAVMAVREFYSEEEDENGNRSAFTEVHRIDIEGSALKYSGLRRLEGTLIGEISVDEESGYLRGLTNYGKTNRLHILDESMEFVIGLDIFNGEKVTRVSYIGNNCYVMIEGEEGEKTVVIDLSDPSSPKVAGKISEKAFSNKLYEVSDTMILGIKDSQFEVIKEENGEDCVLTPMSMTLFDVSDPANPTPVSSYTFDESSKSVASADSRSVMVDAEKKIFGIPVLEIDSERSQRSSYAVFDVSDGKIVCIGTYTHSHIGDAAVRSICIGDILYTVSGDKIVAFDMSADAPENNKLTEFPLN